MSQGIVLEETTHEDGVGVPGSILHLSARVPDLTASSGIGDEEYSNHYTEHDNSGRQNVLGCEPSCQRGD